LYKDENNIRRMAREGVENLYNEGVIYGEYRYAPHLFVDLKSDDY